MKIERGSFFLIGVMLFALILFVVALTYSNAKMRSVPLIASGIILLLGAIQLRQELLVAKKTPIDDKVTEETKVIAERGKREYFIVLAWWVSFVLITYLFGFHFAIPLLALSFMRFRGHRGWLKSIAVAAIAEISIYVIFVLIMKIELHSGIFQIAKLLP